MALTEEGTFELAPIVEEAEAWALLSACQEWKSWTALHWNVS